MRRVKSAAVVVAALAVCISDKSFGAVIQYDLFKTADYTQTSNAQPTTPFNYRMDARIDTNVDHDVTAASLTLPDGVTVYPFTSSTPRFLFYRENGLASAGDLDAAYPAGTYTFTATAGTLAPSSGSIDFPESAQLGYSATVPYLTGNSFSSLQGMDSTANLTLTFDGFIGGTFANQVVTFFTVFDNTSGDVVFTENGSPSVFTASTIPGGVLLPDHAYAYSVTFSDRIVGTGLFGNDSAVTLAAFDLATSGFFQTAAVPEPGIGGLLPLVIGFVTSRRRR